MQHGEKECPAPYPPRVMAISQVSQGLGCYGIGKTVTCDLCFVPAGVRGISVGH